MNTIIFAPWTCLAEQCVNSHLPVFQPITATVESIPVWVATLAHRVADPLLVSTNVVQRVTRLPIGFSVEENVSPVFGGVRRDAVKPYTTKATCTSSRRVS